MTSPKKSRPSENRSKQPETKSNSQTGEPGKSRPGSRVRRNKGRISGIRSDISKAMCSHRHGLERDLARARSIKEPNHAAKVLAKLQARAAASVRTARMRDQAVPAVAYDPDLPISAKGHEIIEAIRKNQVVVITGETGSGKTTQIPKMCLAAGLGRKGLIGCTQPRRVAAVTVSQRIAEELGEELGKSVGYKIRFKEKGGKSKNQFIKIMTDGVLLAEFQRDRFFSQYEAIIVDEAHERSLNIDFILGILKNVASRRRDLKIIITSATIDTEKFSRAFSNAPIVEVSGRMYPVEVRYRPVFSDSDDGDAGYVDAAVNAVASIFAKRPKGDILVFMPTENDIRETCELIEGRRYPNARVLPLFARLAGKEQARVFGSGGGIKIVVATNVAETSITIPGIRYVVDTGLARISRYSPRTGTTSLPVDKISRSSADQRMGRCGRVAEGVCIRLYDQEDYESRPQFTPPEILRANLAEVILRMVAARLPDVQSFPFVDPPDTRSIHDGFKVLGELGAIRASKKRGGEPVLTKKGRIMSRLPVDPRISAILIEAHKNKCLTEALIVASALCIFDPRERPAEKAAQADQAHRAFFNSSSDFLFYLNLWRAYFEHRDKVKSGNQMKKWCKANFLSFKRMKEWRDIHQQLWTILVEEGFLAGPPAMPKPFTEGKSDDRYAPLHQSIAAAYLSQIAMKKEKNYYLAAKGREAMLFPGSGLFNAGGQWIVSAQMVHTSRLFARMAANIEPEWLEEPAGDLCTRVYLEPHYEKNRGEVVAKEQVSLFGLIIISGRMVSYGAINQDEAARIFLQSALVEDQVKGKFGFMEHNRKVLTEARDMEERLRRRDIVVDENGLHRFYEKRLEGVCNVADLKKAVKKKGGDSFLRMTVEDVMMRTPQAGDLSQFPKKLNIEGSRLKLNYRFDPGKPGDGVTIKIPSSLVSSVPPEPLEWVVPGLLQEKVTAMIKGLPKPLRVKLVPVNKTVEKVFGDLDENCGESLSAALSRAISKRMGVNIPAASWPSPEDLPPHLTARLAVTNSRGKILRFGRDIRELSQTQVAAPDSDRLDEVRSKWERKGISTWDFGDLPESVPIRKGAPNGPRAYVCLSPAEDGVSLKVMEDKALAAQTHAKGVAALCAVQFAKEIKHLKKYLELKGDAKQHCAYFGGRAKMEEVLRETLWARHLEKDVRTKDDFLKHAGEQIPSLAVKAEKLAQSTAGIMAAYHKTRARLGDFEKQNRANRPALEFIDRLRKDLSQILPESFPRLYDQARLSHMPRYFNAIALRAERGLPDLMKDAQKEAQVKVFEDKLKEMAKALSIRTTPEKRAALEDFFWMIQELKVSVFAQELKTPFPVSPKRLNRRILEIEMMV